ncbi:MAG: DUF1847 domain-containing protein [Thermoplasmata archaeon]
MTRECITCKSKDCYQGRDCFGLAKMVRTSYSKDEIRSMKVSGEIEADYYMKLCRLEEIMLYAKRMRMRRLGIAFCVGLSEEAEVVSQILKSRGFEVHSACCKICGIDKGDLGIKKIHGAEEAMCNPVGQAMRLNGLGTQMNIVIGLCVGHDMLFSKRSEAPATTFIVKDRMLSHNPAGAIYSSYYKETRFGMSAD